MRWLIFLLLPLFIQAQESYTRFLWLNYNTNTYAVNDTVGSITVNDSVEVLIGDKWKLLTQAVDDTAMVTAQDKTTEGTVTFILAAESYWTKVDQLQFRVYSTGVDTATSLVLQIPPTSRGAVTLYMIADTVGSNVHYSKSYITGN